MHLKRITGNNEIGAAVRRRRQELSLSQEELASRLQISTQQIQRYESGKDRLNVEKLQALALALSVPVSYLLCHDGDVEPSLVCEYEKELLRQYRRISSRDARKIVVTLVNTLASTDMERQKTPASST